MAAMADGILSGGLRGERGWGMSESTQHGLIVNSTLILIHTMVDYYHVVWGELPTETTVELIITPPVTIVWSELSLGFTFYSPPLSLAFISRPLLLVQIYSISPHSLSIDL